MKAAIARLMVFLMLVVPVTTVATLAAEVGHARVALAVTQDIEEGDTYEATGNYWMDGDCMWGEYNVFHEVWLVTRDEHEEPISWQLLDREAKGTETYREWCV